MARESFDTRVKEQLFGLVRIALQLTAKPGTEPAVDRYDWPHVITLARQQTVSGLLDSAIRLLPAQLYPPEDTLVDILLEADRIARRSRYVDCVAEKLLSDLQSLGLHPSLMKGPSVARYYPHPELRVSGDIDLYIPEGELPRVQQYFTRQQCPPVQTPDGSYFCQDFKPDPTREDTVDIDIHNNYYDLHYPEASLPAPGSADGILLMLSSHILKHAMGPGVGLRQICDYAMACRRLAGQYDIQVLLNCFKRTGTLQWNRVLDAFLRRHFHLETGLFPGAVSRFTARDADRLERIVFSGGNFGHFGGRRKKALLSSAPVRKAHTALRFLQRLVFSLRCASREYFRYVMSLIKGNIQ